MYKNVKIGLALGGGAAKGSSHIGVLKVLEKNGIFPDYICGTSMGSIVGGLYASGMTTEQMEKELSTLKKSDLMDFSLLKIRRGGLLLGKKMQDTIEKYSKGAKIEDCKIPFSCVAVNLKDGTEQIFTSGILSEAITASCCVPVVFHPIKKDDMILVDGGLLNNVPCDVVKKQDVDFVIAVNCVGEREFTDEQLNSTLKILMAALDILLSKQARQKAEQYADYYISFHTNIGSTAYNSKDTQKAVLMGEMEAEEHMVELKKMLNKVNNKIKRKAKYAKLKELNKK